MSTHTLAIGTKVTRTMGSSYTVGTVRDIRPATGPSIHAGNVNVAWVTSQGVAYLSEWVNAGDLRTARNARANAFHGDGSAAQRIGCDCLACRF